MAAYYNEIDPYAAQWLRNLIDAGHIAPGEVDTRSIVDVRADELAGFEQCHFFAGLGGWSGALRMAGWPDGRAVWTGSCPCQPFSLAGKQTGFADDRHLWPAWRELIAQRRPAKVYGEQVASAAEWLRLVRGDLEALGYAVGAIPFEAASAGADHLRDRYWLVANGAGEQVGAAGQPWQHGDVVYHQGVRWAEGRPEPEIRSGRTTAAGAGGTIDLVDTIGERGCCRHLERQDAAHAYSSGERSWALGSDGKWRAVKSGIRLLAHGVPARVAKLRAFGNAIDLRPAAAFIRATM